MKRRLLFPRFFAALLLLAVSTLSWAYNFAVDGIYYNINDNGTSVTVTYKTSSYNSYSGSIEIPSSVTYNKKEYSVTNIDDNAFYNCSSLTSVTIGKNVTSIGRKAFYNCSSLTSVTIGNSVTSIGGNAFYGCSNLTKAEFKNIVRMFITEYENYASNPLYYAHHLYHNKQEVIELEIPEGTTSINNYALQNCSNLTSVIIPSSVTSIGNDAFRGCSSINYIKIGEAISDIGSNAFYGCSSLTSVRINSKKLVSKTYTYNSNLNTIFGNQVKEYTIGYDINSIGNYAFYGSSGLNTVYISNGVSTIGECAFYGCSGLNSISIGNGVTIIGSSAFNGCSSLASVTIPNNVTSIENDAFSGCSGLNSIYIGNGVTSIGDNAFYNCNNLNNVEFADIGSIFRIKYGNISSNPLYYAKHLYTSGEEVVNLVIPEWVTSINDYAFYECTSLTSVTFPSSVSSSGSVTSIGRKAFYNCSSLTSVTIPSSVKSISDDAFYGCSSLTSVIIDSNDIVSKTYSSYYGILETIFGKQVKEYILGDHVTVIGNYAFYGSSNLISVTIGNNVTSIGEYAFNGCSNLTSVTVPNRVTSIGRSAFSGCSGLTSVTIGNSVRSIGGDAFYGCSSLTKAEFENLVGLVETVYETEASNPLYYAQHLYFDKQEVTELYILEGTTSINNFALQNCSSLTSVRIPSSVTTIGKYAFNGCSNITSVRIFSNDVVSKTYSFSSNLTTIFGSQVMKYILGENVTGIGDYAFYKCSNLTDVIIPKNVTSIGRYAFYGCSSLNSIYIGDGVTTIGDNAFYDCSSLAYVTILDSVKSIGEYAFYYCKGLTSVTIPNSVTNIGKYAFSFCSGLTSVTIGSSVESIGERTFFRCEELKKVVCKAQNVPTIGSYCFSGMPLWLATLHVTETSIDAYKSAEQWKTFQNIIPIIEQNEFTLNKLVNWKNSILDLLKSLGLEDWDTNNDGSISYGDAPFALPKKTDDNYILIWTSSDTNVAVINNYTITMTSPGTTVLTVSAIDDKNNVIAVKEFGFTVWESIADKTIYNITATASPTNGGRITGAGTYYDGTAITLTATPASGYEFEKWTENGTIVSTQATYTFTVTQDRTLVANFQEADEGNRIKGIYYEFNTENNTASVISRENKYTGDIVIPETVVYQGTTYAVTSIANSAFRECSSMTSVSLSNNVTRIGQYAFYGCRGLTSVTIPNNVTSIGDYAFSECSSITSITIPNGVTSIGKWAFNNCSSLTSIIIPNSVTNVGEYAFSFCSGLTSVTIGSSVTSIGNSAFFNCSGLTSIICQAKNVPTTGISCFFSVPNSTTLYVPASSIDAYKSADQWKDFGTILPIEEGTSYNITVTASPANGGSITGAGTYQDGATVTLTATPAEGYEFDNWTENGTTVSTRATYAFIATQDRTLVANFQEVEDEEPDEGNRIKGIYYSFDTSNNTAAVISGDKKYTGDVVIPETVTYQGNTYVVTSIANYAFIECPDLTSVTISNSVRSIGYSSFDSCTGLTSVTLGHRLTIIGDWAFYRCSGLASVDIPDGVTTIGEGSFSYCSAMTSAIIGNGVTRIGNSAFSYCTSLTSVTLGSSVTSIGNSAFVGCSSLPSIDIPNSVTSIAAGTFWGCTSLKSVTVPSSVESIGSDAFSGCYGLASVTLNSDNIVSAAYSSSNNLKTIFGSQVTRYILGNDVTSIGANAFRGCSDLISVTVPNSVTSIGEGAFAECDGLTSVTLNSNNIVSSTYTSSSNLNTVFGSQVIEYIIGDEVTSIGNYAFYSSTGLTSLTIGNGVTSIGDRAFYGCTGLKNVVCRAQRVPTASSNCFGGITLSSATLYVPASSVNSYKSTSPWSDFGTVTSIPDNFQIWGIKVNKSEILLHAQGNPYQLIATVVPEYAANKALTWTSSNTSVATVDANGLITPVNQGTAVITATTKDGTNLSATCTVTVDADNIIKDVSQLSNDKCYYIYTKDQLRGGLGVNKKYGSLASTFSVTNVKYKTENMSPFVFFKYHDRFLLYSVEANAFVTYKGGLTRMNIIGSNAINVTKNTNEYFMFSFASTGGVVNINTNPGLAINNWGTTSSQFDEGNQFIIEIAGDFDPSVMVALINESETVSDEDEEHYAQTPIQSVSELVNGQVYTAVTNRAAWYVPESGTQLESTKLPIWDKWSCKNTGQQFAFILHDGKYYIYNVGEQKILNGITDNSPNHGELVTDNCQPVTISGTGNLQYPLFFSYGASYNVNINSWGEVVIDTWTTLDDGNMVALRPVQGVTLSESDLRRIIRYIDGSIPGDVNGDGDVNGADIVAVINYVLNDSKTEGDVNGDGEVNGADIVAVINYVLSYTSDAVRQQTYYAHRAPARPTDTSDRLYANTVTDGITVGLTNETDFTAFQFMLKLPEDCTLENVIADGLRLDNHVLQFRRMADGRYFVLGYNLDNENIAGHDGALLRLQLAGNICEGASVTDVMFFTPEAETRHLAGIQIDLVTGLTSLENATEDVTGNIYDMQGRVVMTSGQYAKQKNFLPTGIYIRNGRKFVVK